MRMQAFDFRSFMCSESQLLTWKKEGLPADTLSMENAIMILNSCRTPLIIDPATQASEWLKQNLGSTQEGCEVLNHGDSKFNTQLELSLRFGKVLIIQEVDGIEGMLFPVLRKDLIQQGPRQVVQIGDKPIDYNPAFRLFLTTRDSFVEVPPNANALVTTVNFTVTQSGLEGQLLSITINFEQPELESRKTALLEEEERLKISLAEYEKNLLEELANSEGSLLENKPLIDTLNKTKQSSVEVEKALAESHQLQQSLDQQREVYRNFAHTGADLFMIIGDLIKVNNMYQFSLAAFVKLFRRALETKPQANSIEEKLNYLSNSLIRLCYSEVGRSLFKADRLTYSLHFVKGIYKNLVNEPEWAFFNGSAVASSEGGAPLPRWASKDRKETFAMFSNSFPQLANSLGFNDEAAWGPFSQSVHAEQELPQKAGRLTPF
jgi:dynein heavy chain 2